MFDEKTTLFNETILLLFLLSIIRRNDEESNAGKRFGGIRREENGAMAR